MKSKYQNKAIQTDRDVIPMVKEPEKKKRRAKRVSTGKPASVTWNRQGQL